MCRPSSNLLPRDVGSQRPKSHVSCERSGAVEFSHLECRAVAAQGGESDHYGNSCQAAAVGSHIQERGSIIVSPEPSADTDPTATFAHPRLVLGLAVVRRLLFGALLGLAIVGLWRSVRRPGNISGETEKVDGVDFTTGTPGSWSFSASTGSRFLKTDVARPRSTGRRSLSPVL